MKLALVSIEYPPDPFSAGIGTYTQTLARLLAGRGHQVHVVTRGELDTSRSEEAGVSVHRLVPARPVLPEEFTPWSALSLATTSLKNEFVYRRAIAAKLEALIAQEGLELIEAADYLAEAVFYKAAAHPYIPFITRLHTPFAHAELIEPHVPDIMRQAVRGLERRQCLKSSQLSAPSRTSADVFRETLGLKQKAITVFPNPPSYPGEADEAAETAEDPNLVLFVGRISKWKGCDLLIKTVPQVVAHHPQARFVFAGAHHAPIESFASGKDYLLSLIAERYHPHLDFLGRIPHNALSSYYQQAAVCVFPSRFEAFGYTCLEAMTHGKAIIGSRQGGMVDLLDEGRAGVLYDPPAGVELASHIITLLSQPDLRKTLGERAKARRLEHYSSDTVLDQIEAFYEGALETARTSAKSQT